MTLISLFYLVLVKNRTQASLTLHLFQPLTQQSRRKESAKLREAQERVLTRDHRVARRHFLFFLDLLLALLQILYQFNGID